MGRKVRRQEHVVQLVEGEPASVPQLGGRGRVLIPDVQDGAADPLRGERLEQRLLLDDGAARDVDDDGVGRKEAQRILPDECSGLRGLRAGYEEIVGDLRQIFHGRGQLDLVGGLGARVDGHLHVQRGRNLGAAAADVAIADDAYALAADGGPRRMADAV